MNAAEIININRAVRTFVDKEPTCTVFDNKLIEAALKARLTGTEWAVLMFVASKTWPWGKVFDEISISQIQKATGINKSNISQTVSRLIEQKVFVKNKHHTAVTSQVIGINQDFATWKVFAKSKQGVCKKQTTNKRDINKTSSCPKTKFSDEDMRFAKWMFDELLKNNPTEKKPTFATWANHVRLMRERDKRTHREMGVLFRWAAKDSFWFKNIRSPESLRRQWDRLTLERKGDVKSRKDQSTSEFSEPML